MTKKKPTSALHDLFVSVRRVIVLFVAAFALAMGWPFEVVAARLLILWAVLVVVSHAGEILFQYLSHRAILQQSANSAVTPSGGATSS